MSTMQWDRETAGLWKEVGTSNKSGKPLLFVAGFPDRPTLFTDYIKALEGKYHIFTMELPRYASPARTSEERWGFDFDAMDKVFHAVVTQVLRAHSGARQEKLVLVAHDWGAFFAYNYERAHEDTVSAMITLDVGGHVKPNILEALFIAFYQLTLSLFFLLGFLLPVVADYLTAGFAKLLKYPFSTAHVHSGMNYPYYYMWRNIFLRPFGRGYFAAKTRKFPKVPTLFMYGGKKPLMFHSEEWLRALRNQRGSNIVCFPSSGHWFMSNARVQAEMNDTTLKWLSQTFRS